MEIINLPPHQKNKAAQVLTAAFFDYPMFAFYFPDLKKRTRYLPWYLGNVLNCALRYGEVLTNPDVSGVIFTLPPGHTRISQWEYVQNGFLLTSLVMGPRDFKQSNDCEEFVGNIHTELMKDRPHTYLWGLVVDPARKASGIGTALLQPVLQKADREKMPVYLETHDEKNVAYYRRHGFELIRADRIPKYDLPIWCMVREPS
jgi:N-acetylglutamate synthase-like GNAT family acetyltransferase